MMKPQELLRKYDLHDSGVNDVHYSPDHQKILIDVTFCNWRQLSYREGEPDVISGKLIFTGVSQYEIETEMPEHNFDGDEILVAELLPSQDEQKEVLEITLLGYLFPEKKQVVKTLRIEAEDVVWKVSGPC